MRSFTLVLTLVSRTVIVSKTDAHRTARMKNLNLTEFLVFHFFFSLRLSRLRHARRTRTRPFPARSPRSRFRGTARERPRPAHVRARTRKAHTCVMAFTYTRGVRGSGVLKMHFADKLFDKLPPGTGAGVFRACMYTYNPCDAPRVYSARSLGGMIPTRPPSARPTKLGRFRVVSTCTTAP